MTLTNHYLAGVLIAAVVKTPYIALPCAVASHYVLDALPHYGFKVWEQRNHTIFNSMLLLDVIVFVFVLLALIGLHIPSWYYVAGIFGYLPDLAWVYRWLVPEKFGTLPPKPLNKINAFHSNIQKFERLWGIVPEIVIGTTMFVALKNVIA
jgi:hypothetical protein